MREVAEDEEDAFFNEEGGASEEYSMRSVAFAVPQSDKRKQAKSINQSSFFPFINGVMDLDQIINN